MRASFPRSSPAVLTQVITSQRRLRHPSRTIRTNMMALPAYAYLCTNTAIEPLRDHITKTWSERTQSPGIVSHPSHSYHLAQAHVDASALPNSIAHLTVILHPPFHAPKHVVRITHEQNLIFTIEGWTDTREDYRVLEERVNMIEEQRKNTSLKNWAFVLLEPGGDRAMYTVGNEDLWLAKVLQQ